MTGCQLGGYFMVLVNDAVVIEDVMSARILLVFWM